jgi:hypothetical protein
MNIGVNRNPNIEIRNSTYSVFRFRYCSLACFMNFIPTINYLNFTNESAYHRG